MTEEEVYPGDFEVIDETSYEVGQAMGHNEAYEQVLKAYDLEGVTGVVRWLEHNRPKTPEGWEEYEKSVAGEVFPWETAVKRDDEVIAKLS